MEIGIGQERRIERETKEKKKTRTKMKQDREKKRLGSWILT